MFCLLKTDRKGRKKLCILENTKKFEEKTMLLTEVMGI